jgi:hypothetical protein
MPIPVDRAHCPAAMLPCATGSRDSAHKELIWCARRTRVHGLGGVSQRAADMCSCRSGSPDPRLDPRMADERISRFQHPSGAFAGPQGTGRTEPAGYGERDGRAPGCAPGGRVRRFCVGSRRRSGCTRPTCTSSRAWRYRRTWPRWMSRPDRNGPAGVAGRAAARGPAERAAGPRPVAAAAGPR